LNSNLHLPSDNRLDEAFARFIEFGTLLDRPTRQYLVRYLQQKLFPEAESTTQLPALDEVKDNYYRYFCQALDRLFEGNELLEKTLGHPMLSEQVAIETLQWIRRTYRFMREKNPFEDESRRLQAAAALPLKRWQQQWSVIVRFLADNYAETEIPSGFYREKLSAVFTDEEAMAASEKEAERIIHDLLAQWDARLSAKLLDFQLQRLFKEQQQFADTLEAKSTHFTRLYQLLSPFTEFVGRYWDMAQAMWEESDFDLLERYDELLQNEKSVRELTDLLGRLREAQIITEEEIYETVIERQTHQVTTPEKAEIVGIHESDDLNNLLGSEAGLLADPDTETMFLKKYADKGLLTFRYENQETKQSEDQFTENRKLVRRKEKGPFIVCVDTSDSMRGKPEQIAKILCFAILKLAARDNRRAFLINFSVGVKVIDLFDISRSLDQIVAFLQMSFHGGTDLTLALYETLRQLKTESYKDADVLIVSDFILYKVEADLLEQIQQQQKQMGTRFHCLTLSDDPNAEIIEAFDSNWIYDPKEKGIIREIAGQLRRL
jgi:uncharacterized protein with von Willebrand factor type A (vWA) domain